MPNYCYYEMKIVGDEEKVKELVQIMGGGHPLGTHMYRIFSAVVFQYSDDYDGKFMAFICGDCAWSIATCMMPNGYYMDSQKDGDPTGTTLVKESERLGLKIEAYSREPGVGFEEHYLIDNGKVLRDECEDYSEYSVADIETKEEACSVYGVEFTDEEWDAGIGDCISRGGFEEWEYEI